jgi:hypothetical protein
MSAVKKTISIDENVAKEASALNTNFSAIVEAALIEYIHHHRLQKAMNSFGKWAEREDNSAAIVSSLRKQDERESTTRNDLKDENNKKSGHR